jgi:hypothetical protein
MDIFRFKPNEPTGVRRLAGITAALNTILQGDPNASVLLLLNGRDVTLLSGRTYNYAQSRSRRASWLGLRPCVSDDAGLRGAAKPGHYGGRGDLAA